MDANWQTRKIETSVHGVLVFRCCLAHHNTKTPEANPLFFQRKILGHRELNVCPRLLSSVAFFCRHLVQCLVQQISKVVLQLFLNEFSNGFGCDLRNALQKWKKVVYVKRGVLPENVGSHTNKTGRNTSHGRSGYSTGIGLCNSEGDYQ